MNYRIIGILYYTNHIYIIDAFKNIFKGISGRPRIFGYDIKFIDDNLEVYIETVDNDEKSYYLDISYTGIEVEFLKIKEQVKKCILESDILFDLSFIVNDDEGNEIEEEPFIHPDFESRFISPSDFF